MPELPRARDDVRLVRVEERERQARSRADDPERRARREHGSECRDGCAAVERAGVARAGLDLGTRVTDERLDVAPETMTASTPARSSSRTSPRDALGELGDRELARPGCRAAARAGGRAAPGRRRRPRRRAGGSPGRPARARARARPRRARARRHSRPSCARALRHVARARRRARRVDDEGVGSVRRRSSARGPIREQRQLGAGRADRSPRRGRRGPPHPAPRPPRRAAPSATSTSTEIPSPSAIAWLSRRRPSRSVDATRSPAPTRAPSTG